MNINDLPIKSCGHILEVAEYLRKIGVFVAVPRDTPRGFWVCAQCQVKAPTDVHATNDTNQVVEAAKSALRGR